MRLSSVLYLFTTSQTGGGNKVLQRLISGLDTTLYRSHVVIPTKGPVEDELRGSRTNYSVIDTRSGELPRARMLLNVARLFISRISTQSDILHANELPYRIGSLAFRGKKRVCHVHHPGFDSETLKWIFQIPPHLIITPSHFIADEVKRCSSELKRDIPVKVIWNPIDTDWFRPSECVEQTKKTLGMVGDKHISILGTITPHKGHECFLRMARLVADRLPNTHFHLVGSVKPGKEDFLQKLKNMVEQLGLTKQVHFWGGVTDCQARDILAASDLFVLPSVEEGFGLVLAEAQACEVPVLATRMRPLDEVIDDGKTGYLIAKDQAEDYATKAMELLCDENQRRAMGRRGRQWVIDRFSTQNFTESVNQLYQEIRVT